ncbi:MAG: GNAT family N-acetyltransferase [Chloroflexi bacterium]|nr:GNAT family N-acetyltransferase [Chloroflexota bacterium]
MSDMLVKLYNLPEAAPLLARLKAEGIEVRRAHPVEKHVIAGWVRRYFSEDWAAGCEMSLEQRPATCYIAVEKGPAPEVSTNGYSLPDEKLLGFACYDVSARGMFGPLGVREDYRGRGIGEALLLSCLHSMLAEGYAYAVIGWVGPTEFYAKTVGATIIEGSTPGIYKGPLVDAT